MANNEYFTKQALWRELGLSQVTAADDQDETPQPSPYLSASFCKKVYSSLSFREQRLFGYRTTHGVDRHITQTSVSNLFCPNHTLMYSSITAPNISCTGIITRPGEDRKELLKRVLQFFTKKKPLDIIKLIKSQMCHEQLIMRLSEFNRVQERYPRYFEDYYNFAQSYQQLPSLQKSLEARLGRTLSTTEA